MTDNKALGADLANEGGDAHMADGMPDRDVLFAALARLTRHQRNAVVAYLSGEGPLPEFSGDQQ